MHICSKIFQLAMQLQATARVTTSNSLDSATNEKKLHCQLRNFVNAMQKCTIIPPLFDKHLWYLSERLVDFALFSDQTS